VDRAIADEVVAAEEIARTQLAPSAFSVRYVEGHDQPDTPYGGAIWEAARRHGLNPSLLAAVAQAESAFDARAVSHRGARGLLQLMPATGRRLGLHPAELFEPEKNLDAGARYLRELADRFQDDLSLVLAAYNAGEGAVERFGGVPPYRETLGYLSRIYALLGISTPGA
jgi:soluble lytic murein transglycosylase-like protein